MIFMCITCSLVQFYIIVMIVAWHSRENLLIMYLKAAQFFKQDFFFCFIFKSLLRNIFIFFLWKIVCGFSCLCNEGGNCKLSNFIHKYIFVKYKKSLWRRIKKMWDFWDKICSQQQWKKIERERDLFSSSSRLACCI